ncbi:hypothetical protein [Collimonas fungivorans]|uniref:hypothetical protein n=1 Tax=Collimonas fungivorans TaxID=158899 RepID=UPI0007784A8F|nr:hypothetical protein [Collimonas fungivorans]
MFAILNTLHWIDELMYFPSCQGKDTSKWNQIIIAKLRAWPRMRANDRYNFSVTQGFDRAVGAKLALPEFQCI